MESVKEYIENNKKRFLEELFEVLRIPSISADSHFAQDVLRTAEWFVDALKNAGTDHVRAISTNGFPVVYGEKIIDQNLPTVLVYGHYDVQPAEPLQLWKKPPFEPYVQDEKIFARGACDDKGQVYMHIKAFESMIANQSLPCNVKFLIEGEEEIGSPSLATFIHSNKDLLACDVILISDTAMLANDVPSIDCGLRGLSYVEVEVCGPNRDLHSGVYGGAVLNPINALCAMIASLHNEKGEINIPGFYDRVQILSESERSELERAPFNLDDYQKDLDINGVYGEQGYSTMERASIRPTLDVNGIWGGYTGEGSKTVLPSKAYAKISMRLVPNQSSEEITVLFSEHFKKIAPVGVKVQVKPHHGGEPMVTPIDSLPYMAASKAMEKTFGKKPIPTRGGGSIPIVSLLEHTLNAKTVLMGFGLDTDAIHSPNEHYGLFNFYKGIETIPWFFQYYSELKINQS